MSHHPIAVSLILFAMASTVSAHAETVGQRLSPEEITELLYGATLYGEYVDGRPDWAEQTAVTGQLYDVMKDWKEVGRWSVVEGKACYQYLNNGRIPCFDVTFYDKRYYFYLSGTDELVAITTRVERAPVM